MKELNVARSKGNGEYDCRRNVPEENCPTKVKLKDRETVRLRVVRPL